ncbi:MAG: T9SS type A sorting domain-containing protein [Chitinophagaceae bacterium]
MKQTFILFCARVLTTGALAKPTITGGNVPPVGYSKSLSTGPATIVPDAIGGPNVIWDFSSLNLPTIGTMTVIDPATGPFISQFPTTNFAFQFNLTTGQKLNYYYASSTAKLDLLASDVTSSSTGSNTYTNGRSQLDFPIAYLGTTSDTYQKTSGSLQTTTNTYDGYGTLKTPYGTYNNVVRIKQVNSAFPNPDYMWFQTNPLLNIFGYNSNNNSYFSYDGGTTSVSGFTPNPAFITVQPNPVKNKGILLIEGIVGKGDLRIYSALGQLVKHTTISTSTVPLDVATWATGVYFYSFISTNGGNTKGIFLVE